MSAPLASMTGYARANGEAAGCGFAIEIKSVNSRGLDLRLRLPPGMDAVEPDLRKLIAKKLTRGAVNCTVNLQRDEQTPDIYVNREALAEIIAALTELSGQIGADRPRLDGILGLKGVIETRDRLLGEQEQAALHDAVVETARLCLNDLVSVRQREAGQLLPVLLPQIGEIERLTAAAAAHPSRNRETILARLGEQVAALCETGNGLNQERLHQEALILATKADIQEEIDRLNAHCHAARQLLNEGGPVGRKLDFLAQEFNREANTLCAKSHAVELTAIGLDLKAVIDQYREQIQNLE